MANICYNYLTVESERAEEILNSVGNSDHDIDFNILKPMPENVTSLINPETNEAFKGQRDWGWVNIGCPGVPQTTDVITHSDNEFHVAFETEWAPPIAWFNELGRLTAEAELDKSKPSVIELEYAEYDMEFAGLLTYVREPSGKEYFTQTKYEGEALAEALGHTDCNI